MATSVLSLAALVSSANLADGQQVKADEHNTKRRRWEQRMNKLLGAAQDMQENYAGGAEPNERRDGSIWYDETNTVFKGRKSAAWVEFMEATEAYSQSLSTAGTETFKLGGAIDVNTTQADALGTLISYSMPGGTLSENGQCIANTAMFSAIGTAARLRFNFGATSAEIPEDAFNPAPGESIIKSYIIRTGAATQKIGAVLISTSDAHPGDFRKVVNTTAAETLASAVSISYSDSVSGDETQEVMLTRLLQ